MEAALSSLSSLKFLGTLISRKTDVNEQGTLTKLLRCMKVWCAYIARDILDFPVRYNYVLPTTMHDTFERCESLALVHLPFNF